MSCLSVFRNGVGLGVDLYTSFEAVRWANDSSEPFRNMNGKLARDLARPRPGEEARPSICTRALGSTTAFLIEPELPETFVVHRLVADAQSSGRRQRRLHRLCLEITGS